MHPTTTTLSEFSGFAVKQFTRLCSGFAPTAALHMQASPSTKNACSNSPSTGRLIQVPVIQIPEGPEDGDIDLGPAAAQRDPASGTATSEASSEG
jgi:hypothetical protein